MAFTSVHSINSIELKNQQLAQRTELKTRTVYLFFMQMTQKNTVAAPGWPALYFNIVKSSLITAVWVFVIMHAFCMDITHDEAFSFFLVKTNYFRAMCGTANTHWLNSFFMKLFNLLFGNAPGVLRLHSVISFPFFAFGLFRLAALMGNKLSQLLFCCFFLFNPYLLDFFSLARGYGMALTFQLWLLVFLLEAIGYSYFNGSKWLRVVLLATLMIGANLSYLYTAMGVAGIFMLHLILPLAPGYSLKDKQVRQIAVGFGILIMLTIADLLFIKYYGKDLEFGGDDDFIGSLFGSVWEGSLYYSSYSPKLKPVLTYASFIMLPISIGYFIIRAFREKRINSGLIIAFPVLAIFLLNLFFHLLFRTPFLLVRTALQWLPAGLLLIFLCITGITATIKTSSYMQGVLKTALITVLFFHCWRAADKHYCFEWRIQAGAKEGLQDLCSLHAKHPVIHDGFGGVYFNYYRYVNKDFAALSPSILDEEKLKEAIPGAFNKVLQADYVILSDQITFDYLHKSGVSYHIVKKYPYTSATLIRLDTPQNGY